MIVDAKKYSESWYESLSGQASLGVIDALCNDAMSEIFGYYALELGTLSGHHNLLNHSRIPACFSLVNQEVNNSKTTKQNAIDQNNSGQNNKEVDKNKYDHLIVSEIERLPIETDNVDLVVASHIFELSKEPHQVLREIDRVLVPEGHCILFGFNPFSVLTSGRFLKPSTYKRDVTDKMRAVHRVKDWFSVLGFEIVDVQYFGFRPPIKNKKMFERLHWLEKWGGAAWPVLGNMYMVHAKKQVVAMRPHKKVWKAPAVLTGGKVALNRTARKIRHENYFKL